jgi:hypothetical protein
MDSININVLVEAKEVSEIITMVENAKPGKYELKEKFLVIREISIGRSVYKKGEFIFLHPSEFIKMEKDTRKGAVRRVEEQPELNELIRKIKLYIDFRGTSNIPDVEFSSDFKWIKVYPKISKIEPKTKEEEKI